MTKELQEKIKKEIEVNENHIDKFPLETETGTKKMKKNFHRKAVEERNAYIEKELPKFKEYQKATYLELDNYVKNVFPKDKTNEYEEEKKLLEELLRIIPLIDEKISLEIKLGLAHIFYQLSEKTESSLMTINQSIADFIHIMKDANIELTVADFNYSPFVKEYMDTFLSTRDKENFEDIMQTTFKEIYWECPELITHIKRNLIMIVKKHYTVLKTYSDKITEEMLTAKGLTKDNILKVYQEKLLALEDTIDKDEFLNLQMFLGKSRNVDDYTEGAPLRSKSFNQLVIKDTYAELTEEEKKVFDVESINLERHLEILKEYYNYESIIKDLIEKFMKKEESKTKYDAKNKEIETEEKNREKLYKDYLRASGIGFLAKKNETKMAEIKVKIKEVINKLTTLYQELEELEIDVNVGKYLTEGSSVYDLLVTSLSSYIYIENILVEKFQDIDVDFNLANCVKRYMKFIYNPNADFLHKITALLDYDIAEVISEKYGLLGMNVEKDAISQDSIDTTVSSVKVTTIINNIKRSNLTIEEIKLICDIKKIDYTIEDEIL